MKAGIGFCKVVVCAGLGAFALAVVANAAPQRVDMSDLQLKKGMVQEGPQGPAVIWLDEATRARGGAATGGIAEALIFHQPNDSGFGNFEITYDDGPLWYCRMGFANGWQAGDSISSYELKIFHSSSDDINHGPADYSVELWDGDPLSLTETVCATGGVSAPIPGTQGIIAGVPYATVVTARVELPAKVVYGCDRVWMVMTSLSGCRAAWRISGVDGDTDNVAPAVGFGNGRGVLTGCNSSTFGGACPTATGFDAGFCCGSIAGAGTCSGSGDPCSYVSDCPDGETCDGREVCDHTLDPFPIPCSSGGAAVETFCGDGLVDYYFASVDAPNTEEGNVGSIFAATATTMSIVPVSVGASPSAGGSGAGVISLGGDEVVLQAGNQNVWMEIMVGDWSPDTLAGYMPALDAIAGFASGLQGNLSPFVGPDACGECSDNLAACFSNAECTIGTCSGLTCDDDGTACAVDTDCTDPALCNAGSVSCHLTDECNSGETCDNSALCSATVTANADCAAVLGIGSTCAPPGYYFGTGTCSWTYTDAGDPRWALKDATATLAALDVSSIDARPSYAVVVGPPAAPSPFPTDGMYLATLAVAVPADAKGTFTIGLKPFPASALSGGSGAPIPLLGTIPGFITVQTGRCCFNLQDLLTGGADCLDGNQTAGSCAQLAGVTAFTPNDVCPVDSVDCGCVESEASTFNDNDACTDDTCVAGVPTHTTRDCVDGLVCTDDNCDPDDMGGKGPGCFYTPVNVDDGLDCTIDGCTEARGIFNDAIDVNDGIACTFDTCSEGSAPDPCTSPIAGPGASQICNEDLSVVPNPYACSTGDPLVDGCPGADGVPELISTACTDGFCHCILCFTNLPCSDILACRANIEIAWSSACAGEGEKVTANVMVGPPANNAAVSINGGQFVLYYDTGCMTLNNVGCSAPYGFEIYRDVSDGRIQLACGVDPFVGVNGPASGTGASLATASFTKLDNCSSCATSFSSVNPDNSAYTDNIGQPICADIVADAGFGGKAELSLSVPGDMSVNSDCNANTALVTWAAPSVSGTCGATVGVECFGQHESGLDMSDLAMTGGEHPQGETTYTCNANMVSCNSGSATASWTVTVNSDVSIDVTVQLSPVIAGDVTRCIKFTLYEDCTASPTVIERNLFFGGLFDFVGHFTGTIKAPKGQYGCITAQDQLHSLRACAMLGAGGCVDGSYVAVFKGDPFFPGGNWLQQGNLDGWKSKTGNDRSSNDVIDIFDFGTFMALYLSTPAVNTPCSSVPRDSGHGDINGDGIVDVLDLGFVLNNFLTSSKDCCCGAAAGVTVPRTEVSVRELRQMGLGDLAIADLDGNGLVNMDDINAFMAGDRPVKVAPVRGVKGSGVRSR